MLQELTLPVIASPPVNDVDLRGSTVDPRWIHGGSTWTRGLAITGRVKVQIQMTKNDVIIQIPHPESSLNVQNLKFRRRSAGSWSFFCAKISRKKKEKPNLRVKRAWVETPGAWISFFVSGPPFTPYQEFLHHSECLYRIQPPRKPPETRFCCLKRSNNAIIMKIVVPEVDLSGQRLDESGYEAYSQN